MTDRRFPRATPPALASRRDALRVLAGAGLVPLVGCGSDAAPAGGASSATDAGVTADSDAGLSTDASAVGWARGGTAAMTGKATYPAPFTGMPASCALVATTTEGPCTTVSPPAREDVSEGWAGLPVRLAIRVVNASCSALAGRTVRIWHTNYEGSYSGATPNNGMCLKQSDYATRSFFRGEQATNADGIAFFDTCFPGWYRGRAVHVHFQVFDGTTSTRVSQLFFPEDLTAALFASHEDYRSYGQPDTTFANDNVIAAIAAAQRPLHVLDVQRMADGAMLASKTVAVV